MNTDDRKQTGNKARRRGWVRLAVCVGAIGVVWLAALPWAARMSAVRARIARDEAAGVDPSAKFYTELPGMPGILGRVEEIRRREAGLFSL